MKSIFLFVILAPILTVAQLNSKQLKKFEKEVNKNLALILLNRNELQKSSENFGATDKEVINPFYDYDFEIIEPFSIDVDGNIDLKILYKKPDNFFVYQVKGHINSLLNYGVDIFFVLNFEKESLTVTIENIQSGESETFQTDYLHLGIDQTKMRRYAKEAGIKEEYFYP